MKISVLIPTYRRLQDLERCLEGIKKQSRPPNEVVVVARDTDTQTLNFLKTYDPQPLKLNLLVVNQPGQVAALNAGLKAATGCIISITDDDAVPHADWLERIEKQFAVDKRVGAVGGRDWIHEGSKIENGEKSNVGQVQWIGRIVGNHHLGTGKPREVDWIKGANMSYRRTAILGKQFDSRLKGEGAQGRNDMAFCLALKKDGWKLIYDPAIAVDHYPGKQFENNRRNEFNALAQTYEVHNETLSLLEYFSPLNRIIYFAWALFVGTKGRPGLAQCLRLILITGDIKFASSKYKSTLYGHWIGLQTWKESTLQRPSKNF